MAKIEVSRRHGLGFEAAHKSVEAVALHLKRDLRANYAWQGDTLVFECPGAQGRIHVAGDSVRVTVDLGWMLGPLRGQIERSICQYLDEGLA